MTSNITNVNISPGYRSDHSIVTISLKNDQVETKHKCYWKFNNSLLNDKNYAELINEIIIETTKQYALPVYNHNNFKQLDLAEIELLINDQLFFETLLLEIRGKTIAYSSFKKRENEKQEKNLNDEIKKIESEVDLGQEQVINLEQKKLELQELREIKIRGMIVRSRSQWLQNGEKPSRYFLNLENRNFASKRMCFLINDNNETIFEQKDLIDETKKFYENLYRKRDIDTIELNNLIKEPVKLNDTDRDNLEGEISYYEAISVLKRMKNNRSPGNSGFTVEFYKFFFCKLGHFLVRSINYGFREGQMSITQRQGVITCLPKEGKNTQYLNNWRPISLLNVSYKIALACITERLKEGILDKLIHSNQKGFMSNRHISENIALMYDIISFTNTENIPGMLLLVDFQKAFDTIAWDFIDKVLAFYNFGPEFRKWVRTFYNNITSCVSVNGRYSEYFNIERGVRQGDPLSPYLFLLCAEILSQILRENNQIKGLKIRDKEAFLSQFADDTALYLDGSRESFCHCIGSLSLFASISGLTINYEKTIVVWLGSKKGSTERFLRDRNFLWDPGGPQETKFKYLGIIFSTDLDKIVELNYENKIENITRILKIWSKRSLTPYGKITVIKTLALSKLTYLMMNLPDPTENFLKRLQTLFFNFVWDWKPNRIAKEYMYLPKDEGGFNMVNVFDYVASLKLGWFKKAIEKEECKSILFDMYPMLSELKHLGNEYFYKIPIHVPNQFWLDIYKHVLNFVSKRKPENFDEFVCEFIFYNKNLLRNNHCMYSNNWIQNNVFQIFHLLTETGNFKTYDEFMECYPNIITNFLEYHGLVCIIKKYLRTLKFDPNPIHDVQEPVGWRALKGSKQSIRKELLDKPSTHVSVNKWNAIFDNLDWNKIYCKCNKISSDVKLKWFQMRLLYRILPTNRFLYVKKITDYEHCNFCITAVQTIQHLFWDCPFVRMFWRSLENQFISKISHAHLLQLSEEFVLFGCKENVFTDKPIELFILCAKYYIHGCKISDTIPSANIFLKIFKHRYNLEKYYHRNNNK